MKRSGFGMFLLKSSVWIRRQGWLRSVYQHLPHGVRNSVSALLVARVSSGIRFVRTPAWSRAVADPRIRPLKVPEADAKKMGLNLIGYIRGQFGLAESSRMYARALINAGVPVALCDVDLKLSHGWADHSLEEWITEDSPYPVSLVFINPDFLPLAMRHVGRKNLENRYLIACWFWELERIPDDWLPSLDFVDEIMVASEFVEAAFRRVTDKPILRVPLPLGELVDSGLEREDFGLEDGKFIFLCTFDFNSWIARKNPFAVIEAFRAAFSRDRDDVRLLIKSSNGFRHPDKLQGLLEIAAGDARVVLRDDVIDAAHVHALQRCCDAYVSLHRAEGFGLGLAESMLAGKPVIATGWSGNLEFMNEDNSCLVGYAKVCVRPEEYPGAIDQEWAEADLGEAAHWMRRLVDEPGLAAQISSRAQESVRRVLSPQSAALAITSRLKQLAIEVPHGDSVSVDSVMQGQ